MEWIQLLATIVCSVLASSGLWTIILKKMDSKDIKTQMLIGLGHDRIVHLGMTYIARGWITDDEYENLYDYLYVPYKELGGNGSAQRVMEDVQKLEIKRAKDVYRSTESKIYIKEFDGDG